MKRTKTAYAAILVVVFGIGGLAIAGFVGTDAPPAPAAAVAAPVATPVAIATPASDRTLTGGSIGVVHAVSISPGSDRILAVRDRGVDVWRSDGAHLAWLAVDGDPVDGAGWSRDGARVIVWGGATVRLWNADTGAMIGTLQAGMGRVVRAELLPDGAAVTTGADGRRRHWNAHGEPGAVERAADVAPASCDHATTTVDATSEGLHVFLDARGEVRIAGIATAPTAVPATAPVPGA